jgi:hypothetical protein
MLFWLPVHHHMVNWQQLRALTLRAAYPVTRQAVHGKAAAADTADQIYGTAR